MAFRLLPRLLLCEFDNFQTALVCYDVIFLSLILVFWKMLNTGVHAAVQFPDLWYWYWLITLVQGGFRPVVPKT